MKNILLLATLVLAISSCRVNLGKRIKGNGNVTSESRDVDGFSRIKIRGGMTVELVHGASSVRVEADENLMRYIVTREEDGWLVIRTRDNVNLRSSKPIKVYVSADRISAVNIAGSGNLVGRGKFAGADKLDIDVAGSGDVTLDVNTPNVSVDIAGSGNVTLSGETRDARVNITGSGNYDAEELMTETTDIDIAGSGDATVHADQRLKADVLGSGNVYYRGKATVNSKSTGSGKVRPLN